MDSSQLPCADIRLIHLRGAVLGYLQGISILGEVVSNEAGAILRLGYEV